MGKRITIQLSTPIEGHDGKIYSVVIREPNVFEVLELGDPYIVGSSAGGAQLVVENNEAISQYMKRCVVEPTHQDLLRQGGVELARQLKEAIISFFLPGAEEVAASETSPTTSSSAATGASPTSAT